MAVKGLAHSFCIRMVQVSLLHSFVMTSEERFGSTIAISGVVVESHLHLAKAGYAFGDHYRVANSVNFVNEVAISEKFSLCVVEAFKD